MPRARKACASTRCPRLATPGASYCPEHQPPAWRGSTRSRRLPSDWSRLRTDVLNRDGYLCRIGGPGCTLLATEVDHVRAGDDHDPRNLQALCATCHRAKTQAEAAEARARYRGTTVSPD